VPEPDARLTAALADRYALQRELGRGGMATVYLAQDLKHERRVALKVLRPELAAMLGPERFLREVRISAQMTHPHILPLHDSGNVDGFLYYVMPYVDGESLRDRLNREKQLPLDDALQITREVADALAYAHGRGVIHRDIKPENILLESGHAVVADFGIARAIDQAGGDRLTDTGVTLGSPAYMSPEQAGGDRDLDGRSDLYSLGCVLYEMLAGQAPFTGPSVESVVHQHLAAQPPNITSIRPAIPAQVATTLLRALTKTPADRFASVALFAEALGPRGSATIVLPPAVTSARRGWLKLAIGAGALVAVTIVGTLVVRRPAGQLTVPVAPAHPRTAIAVLPFENLSAEGPHAYFAGGLQDELLTQLSKVAALTVISRTSVMGYAGRSTPLRQIATELGVGSVVEGSVQIDGGRLRVNVQLIDAATDAHLWAERYDRRLDDAFAVQSDVAQRIVAAVGAAVTSAERQELAAASTANAEAYRLYLQGVEYTSRPGGRQNFEIAQGLYERALALDPGFALAHAALSHVHGTMYWQSYDPSPARAARQQAEADAALRLAPDLPQAHFAMGLAYYWGRRDYRRALGEFAIAREGLPNSAGIWNIIGAVHRRLGDWSEAIAAYEKAAQLDPRSVALIDQFTETYVVMHRYAEAVRKYDQAVLLAPDFHIAAVSRGWAYVSWQGRLDTLRAVLGRLPRDADLGGLGTPAHEHAQLLLWERQADSLLQVLQEPGERVFVGQRYLQPASLYAAWAQKLRRSQSDARAAFDSARVLLDSVLRERPGDWRVHAARGMAVAGLDRRDEAIREARWLQQSVVYRDDALDGPAVAEDRARILAQAGESEAALDEIERLLARPSRVSVHTLRLDPRWDLIREHTRFKALLARYANPKPAG
jgi:TolB-like protein/tRNA A-37 threonylcarbamoyl transferase component Bud32/Flp pilus assembly protein TadD